MESSAAYALLAVPFLAAAVVVAVVAGVVAARRARRAGRSSAAGRRTAVLTGVVAGVALLVMTIVFDNVIVTLRIVAYDPSRISGLRIGAVPVEDLAYALAAVLLLPSVWVLTARPSRDAAARTDAAERSDEPTRGRREGEPTR